MSLSRELDDKIRNRFDELINEVEELLDELDESDPQLYAIYREWVVKTSALLQTLFANSDQGKKYQKEIESDTPLGQIVGSRHRYMSHDDILRKAATLRAIEDSYIKGFYLDLEQQIIANVSADYMEQAEALLGEGIQGQYVHVPAAVLCGAVLENRLRLFCEQQDPPIETRKKNGDPKTLGPLIGELERRNLFDKLIFMNLKVWAKIRNSAAHGRFEKFTRHDVESMLSGVRQFLSTHL